MFASDFSNYTVNIFDTKQLSEGNPTPVATIDEPSGGCPYDMALDKKGTLYLGDQCLNQVEEYSKGSTTLKTTITDGSSAPTGIAIDKSGTLYVSELGSSEIEEYAGGSTSPTKTITGMSEPFGISLDKKGNLYIPDFGCECVWELPAGGSSVTNMGLARPQRAASKRGRSEDGLPLGDRRRRQSRRNLRPPVNHARGNYPGQGFPYSVSVQNKGKPLDETVYGDQGSESVYVFKANSYTPFATVTDTGTPTGLLLEKQ